MPEKAAVSPSPLTPERLFLIAGALNGFVAVAAGAFGAHALRALLSPAMLAVFDTGSRYQLIHALALIATGFVWARWPGRVAVAAGWLFLAGTVVFCGSLYALALSGIRSWGAITPIGGVMLLSGWLCLAWACRRQVSDATNSD